MPFTVLTFTGIHSQTLTLWSMCKIFAYTFWSSTMATNSFALLVLNVVPIGLMLPNPQQTAAFGVFQNCLSSRRNLLKLIVCRVPWSMNWHWMHYAEKYQKCQSSVSKSGWNFLWFTRMAAPIGVSYGSTRCHCSLNSTAKYPLSASSTLLIFSSSEFIFLV